MRVGGYASGSVYVGKLEQCITEDTHLWNGGVVMACVGLASGHGPW